jgi:NCS1 nucleoside transporter family
MTTEAQFLDYGTKVATVEPGGVEQIPEGERHGKPWNLLATWTSPNLEFATITVGILGPLYFGMSFWSTFSAIVVGTALGALSHGVLSTWGPRSGLAQMVLSRTAFDSTGNVLPAGLNALVAGIGWFAVNSISGSLALHALFHGPKWVWLLVVVVAQMALAAFGHNMVQAFERYAFPILGVLFVVGAIIVFSKSHVSTGGGHAIPGAWLIECSAALGYAVGWNPYASDYTRYFHKTVKSTSIAAAAFLGVFVSCVFLESAGAAMVSAAGKAANVDPGVYSGLMPTWLGDLTLIGIAAGAIAANALNIYSGAMSALALGIRIPLSKARAAVAIVFGVIGFFLALSGLHNAGEKYNNFLLVIAYWITPWLAVVFVDRFLRRGQDVTKLALSRTFNNPSGVIAMFIGMAVSIWLFSNQTEYLGLVPKHHPAVGDITPFVGFVVSAVIYTLLRLILPEENAE